MAFVSLSISAQNSDKRNSEIRKELKENYSPEQRAELISKKMTLNLDLNDNQQKQLKELLLTMKKEKPNFPRDNKEMSAEEKFEFKTNQMNRRITRKREFKKILTPEQYHKWEQRNNSRVLHHKRY